MKSTPVLEVLSLALGRRRESWRAGGVVIVRDFGSEAGKRFFAELYSCKSHNDDLIH